MKIVDNTSSHDLLVCTKDMLILLNVLAHDDHTVNYFGLCFVDGRLTSFLKFQLFGYEDCEEYEDEAE